MSADRLTYRERTSLPRLSAGAPRGAVVLDINVLVNTREPPEVTELLQNLTAAHMSAPTLAELSWTRGRLDPDHPLSATAITRLDAAIARVRPERILTTTSQQWSEAGTLAGHAAKGVAGATRSLTATDRSELISDALTAVVACAIGATIITADADFDLFLQLEPELKVLFYG